HGVRRLAHQLFLEPALLAHPVDDFEVEAVEDRGELSGGQSVRDLEIEADSVHLPALEFNPGCEQQHRVELLGLELAETSCNTGDVLAASLGNFDVRSDGSLPHELGGGVDNRGGVRVATEAFLVADLGHQGLDVGEIEQGDIGTPRVELAVTYDALFQGDAVHPHRPVQVGEALGPHRPRFRRARRKSAICQHIEGHAPDSDATQLNPLAQSPAEQRTLDLKLSQVEPDSTASPVVAREPSLIVGSRAVRQRIYGEFFLTVGALEALQEQGGACRVRRDRSSPPDGQHGILGIESNRHRVHHDRIRSRRQVKRRLEVDGYALEYPAVETVQGQAA